MFRRIRNDYLTSKKKRGDNVSIESFTWSLPYNYSMNVNYYQNFPYSS